MKTHIARVMRMVLGWSLVGLGIVGLFVPILQGILLLILGLWVLSIDSRWAHRCILRLRVRFPKAHRRARRLGKKFREKFPWISRDLSRRED